MNLLDHLRIHPIGMTLDLPEYFLFWGNRKAQLESIRKSFPQFTYRRCRQTHSDLSKEIILDNRSQFSLEQDFQNLPEADAFWTTLENEALLIATADCNPILMYNKKTKTICSIHAGWRGVASNILGKTLQRIQTAGLSNDWVAIVGPHIEFGSFEVEKTVASEILKSVDENPRIGRTAIHSLSESHCRVDLFQILKEQALRAGLSEQNILNIEIDTLTNLNFHSYRRDKEQSGRQFSFVVKKKLI